MRTSPQTLFVDADDTLWENNIHFEAVVDQYCRLLAARGVGPDAARGALLRVERVRTKTHGYGVANFAQAMRLACRELLGEDHETEMAELDGHCAGIRCQTVEILPGVRETLEALRTRRHTLVLLTKGNREDQLDKVARSGLAPLFEAIDVVPEKDEATYLDAMVRHGARSGDSWMIGNSPRSDILPALAAGLGAVFVPHPATWALELDTLPERPTDRFLRLERFEQLTNHF